MSVFKEEMETKRVIFNIRLDLAERLEQAKEDARLIGKKLDHETVLNKSLEKFLKKAEKKLAEKKIELGFIAPQSAQTGSEGGQGDEMDDEGGSGHDPGPQEEKTGEGVGSAADKVSDN